MGSTLMRKRDCRYEVLGTVFCVVVKKRTARCLVQPVKRQFLFAGI